MSYKLIELSFEQVAKKFSLSKMMILLMIFLCSDNVKISFISENESLLPKTKFDVFNK